MKSATPAPARTFAFAALAVAVFSGALRPADSAAAAPDDYTLPNGLRCIVVPHRRDPGAASVRLVVRAGSLDERDDERGFAHFVEHLAFNGTRHHPPGQLRQFFQEIGLADGADLNAFTGYSHTIYKIDLPAGRAARLGDTIAVLRDFADGLTFDPAEVNRERGVVLSELAARVNDASHITEQRFAALFAGTRLPDRAPIGATATLDRAAADTLRAFYRRCYSPARMTVVIVGDVEPAAAKDLLAAHLGSLQPDETAVPPSPFAPPPVAEATRAHFISSATILGAEVVLAAVLPVPADEREPSDDTLLAVALLHRRLAARRQQEAARYGHFGTFHFSSGALGTSAAGLSLSSAADDWESGCGSSKWS